MSSQEIIRVENISKKYKLGVYSAFTLRDDVASWIAKFRKKTNPNSTLGDENRVTERGEFWALRDISFSVSQGEILGIVGRNGAGKSTLLKILSRITHPDNGTIKIKGRVGSLLEVGTGFHPELTGLENIYLNGAILGMSRHEIKSKLEEIIEFSGVKDHIGTPVKRYSSGMKVRLGFAVAAHLEPEILIIDEVLAVGDAEFQKKCIGKMQDVSHSGRTILFVSHNMTAVRNLCSRVIQLDEGQLCFNGDTHEAVKKYLGGESGNRVHFMFTDKNAPGIEHFKIKEIQVFAKDKKIGDPILMEDQIRIKLLHDRKVIQTRYDITLQFKGESGEIVFANGSGRMDSPSYVIGEGWLEVTIPGNLLNMGVFEVNILVVEDNKRVVYQADSLISFTVVPKIREFEGWQGRSKGDLYPNLEWTYQSIK